MSTEDFKTIKVDLDYADKDGNHSIKPFTIKINKVKDISEKGLGWSRQLYSLSFSLTIPDHYYNSLKGQSIPLVDMGKRNEAINYNGLIKTISSDSLKTLTERYWAIHRDFCWLKRVEKRDLEKVIFYSILSHSGDYSSQWDGLNFGKENNMSFKYGVGYVGVGNTRHNKEKVFIGESNNRDFYKLKYVAWTHEREEFFDKIQSSFDNIISKLTDFEKNLNEDTINAFISNKNGLYLS